MISPTRVKQAVQSAVIDRRPDAAVFYGRFDPDRIAGRTPWVSVTAGGGDITLTTSAGGLGRYTFDWDLTVHVGSGPSQAAPEEADDIVWDLLVDVLAAVDADHTLGLGASGVESSRWTAVEYTVEWGEDDSLQAVLSATLRVTVRSEGKGNGNG